MSALGARPKVIVGVGERYWGARRSRAACPSDPPSEELAPRRSSDLDDFAT